MRKGAIRKPVIYEVGDVENFLETLETDIVEAENQEYILNYPTIYIHNWTVNKEYEVYVGEANDIIRRTKEHYSKVHSEEDWQRHLNKKDAKMYVIGHEHFNKSLTMDIENRLMNYMLGVKSVRAIYNKRGNAQRNYYPSHERDAIFQKMWRELQKKNSTLFPSEKLILDSAIFKASPLHELTDEQNLVKEKIVNRVNLALKTNHMGQIIFVLGEAGTGKTVLNSTLFYDICNQNDEDISNNLECHLLVNHEQQLIVYQQIAEKLDLGKGKKIVNKPTSFINKFSRDNPVDVVLIDEAHLLLTRGKQSYRGCNQLQDIRERAKVVVVMFDKRQILKTEQFWESVQIDALENEAKSLNNYFSLKRQLRIKGNQETVNWINEFTQNQRILEIPKDDKYEIQICDNPEELEKKIREKANVEETSLSRIIATFDWEYSGASRPKDHLKKYWEVAINNWSLPWNLEINVTKEEKRKNKKLAWAEQEHTIGEVGSTFTIQGFDLNYAAVILGPSVKYRSGKIIYDPTCSKNKNATSARRMSDGTKQKFGEVLISNEVNVLMTRGVQGVYIYAYDDELRTVLKKAKQ